jgi:hypothetical protein
VTLDDTALVMSHRITRTLDMLWSKLPLLLLPFAAMVAPLLAAFGIVVLDRKRDSRLKRRMPINAKVLPGGGESLRKELVQANERIDDALLTLTMVGPLMVCVWAITRLDWSKVRFGTPEVIYLLACLGASVWSGRVLRREVRQRRLYQEGLVAERFTAQELNRLMAFGCAVFHDVPGEIFNIDHVVVGNGVVYAVETKSRRKPEGKEGHKVGYDGTRLTFPDHVETEPVAQAQRNATWLAGYLRSAMEQSVRVVPVLALPGWYVDANKEGGQAKVRVVAVGGRSALFMADQRSQVDPGFRNAVSQAILARFPATEPEK